MLGCVTVRAQNDEQDARRIAEAGVKAGALEYLTDRDFKIEGPQIEVIARAIDPQENVKVKIIECELLPGRVDLKFKIDARFKFEGNVTMDDTASDVRGEANIGQLITMEAKYWIDDRGLHVDAKATGIKFSVKIHELEPENVAGGKSGLAKIAVQQLRRQKEDLLREFNDWHEEYNRKAR